MSVAKRGKVVFVTSAPGGKDALPLRAHDALATAELVVEDAAGLDEGIARARAGQQVVRLGSEDPLLGSRHDEVERVARAGVPFEIVPGLAAETALGAWTGVALGASYTVLRLPQGLGSLDWATLAHATPMLVVLCTRSNLGDIVAALLEHGRSPDTPALAAADLGRPRQRSEQGSLSDIATRARRLTGPDPRVLVVGEAVAHRDALRWFDRRPLFGKRVLVTRTAEQSHATLELLRSRGADPLSAPTIEICPPPDPGPMQRALGEALPTYDFVVFTSENGVERAWEELVRQGKDARAFGRAFLAAIGPGTARALGRHGLTADLVAREFLGESLAEALIESPLAAEIRSHRGKPARVLVARALVARDVVPEALRAAGFEVDVVPLYETRVPGADKVANLARALEDDAIDAVTFTSKSTVDNLCSMLASAEKDAARLLAGLKVAAIGPITRDAAEERGIRVDVVASPYTVDALVDALEASFAGAYS